MRSPASTGPASRCCPEPPTCRRDFLDLLSPDDIDDLVAERGLRMPFFRMVREGTVQSGPTRYATAGSRRINDLIDADRARDRYAEGATLVLQSLHRIHPPVVRFCRRLAADLGHATQANAYITPPGNRGFDPHHDTHDVFVLQIDGSKLWHVFAPAMVLPLSTPAVVGPREAAAARARGRRAGAVRRARAGRRAVPAARLRALGRDQRRPLHPPHRRRARDHRSSTCCATSSPSPARWRGSGTHCRSALPPTGTGCAPRCCRTCSAAPPTGSPASMPDDALEAIARTARQRGPAGADAPARQHRRPRRTGQGDAGPAPAGHRLPARDGRRRRDRDVPHAGAVQFPGFVRRPCAGSWPARR